MQSRRARKIPCPPALALIGRPRADACGRQAVLNFSRNKKYLYFLSSVKFIIATELRFLGSEIVYPQPHVGTRYWVATELAFFWSDFVGIRCIAI